MKFTTDLLQQKLQSVEQFETLFNSATHEEFETHYAALQDHLSQGGLKSNQAFDEYQFAVDDPRVKTLQICMQKLQALEHPQVVSKSNFDSLFTMIISHVKHHMRRVANQSKPIDFSSPLNLLSSTLTAVNHRLENVVDGDVIQNQRELFTATQELIALQKIALQHRLDEQKKSENQAEILDNRAQKHNHWTAKCARYSIPAVTFFSGASLVTLSTLAHFSPKFAMSLSLHVPPVALATVTIFGTLLAAYGLYHAIRAYHSTHTASVDAPHSIPTAADMMLSLSITGFAALMYFSPRFALVVLHLPPIAFVTLTTMGAALMAYGFYRAYQAYKHANPTPPTTDEAPASTSCKTQISLYLSYCFKFGDTTVQRGPDVDLNLTYDDLAQVPVVVH